MIAFVRQGVNAAQSIQFEVAIGHFAWLNELWVKDSAPISGSERSRPFGISSPLWRIGCGVCCCSDRNHIEAQRIFVFDLGVTILAMFYFYQRWRVDG